MDPTIVAVVPNITENEKYFLDTIFDKSMGVKPEILDPISFSIEEDSLAYYVFFGNNAFELCKSSAGKLSYIILPELKLLKKETGDTEARQRAWNALLGLKRSMDNAAPILQNDTLDAKLIPTWLMNSLESFLNSLSKREITSWKIVLRNGRQAILTEEPIDCPDVLNITFSELLMLKAVHDIFGIEEVSFEYNNKSNSKSNSSKNNDSSR